ncbi:MAG: alpha/beta hydrolase [Anaerolineaceae bacterium]|nr:MAG: alpha/beta hydrolase [Anaerolineaceae bacterium]
MSKMILIVVGVILLVLIIGAGIYLWNSMNKPLYEPGLVRAEKNLRAPLVPPAQMEDSDFWQVEPDIQLHHFNAGEGRNVLIIHGGPGQPYLEAWPGLEALAGDYRFHYYDQRGAGQSTRPIDTFDSKNFYANSTRLEETLGLSAQLADIERIRQILGEEKLIIIGHSFGAFQAALYAAEFPEHVEALVLVTPASMLLMPMEVPGLFETVEELLPADMLADYQTWQENYFDFGNIFSRSEDELVALNEEFARYFVAALADENIQIPENARPGGWMVHAMYLSMGQRHDYRPAMESVTAPVLIVHAADDFQAEAASRTYLDVFPHAQFETIADAGHMVFYDQPAQFAEVVSEFLP